MKPGNEAHTWVEDADTRGEELNPDDHVSAPEFDCA